MVETRRLTELTGRLGDLLDTPDGDVAVALSGGADSASLAYLLADARRPFRAIHIDHGLPDSPILAKAAKAVAESVGVDLESVTIDIPAGASLEGRARDARYQACLRWLRPDEWLLTAHTRDDQAETVLMNLLRGSGPTGLAGIPPRTGSVARPMLAVSRSETRELAGLANLPFHDDPTNLDPSGRRNAIRLEVLPALSARFNPRLVDALARSADLIRSDDTFLGQESESIRVMERELSLAIAIGELWASPRSHADRVLRSCLARLRPPHSGTTDELDQIWAVASGERTAASLAGGVAVAVEGPLLVFKTDGRLARETDVVDLVVGTNNIAGFEVIVENVDRVCRVAPMGAWSAIFDPKSRLTAKVGDNGILEVEANSELAWVPGQHRFAVAWYQPGTNGYLSVFATEEPGWTSSL